MIRETKVVIGMSKVHDHAKLIYISVWMECVWRCGILNEKVVEYESRKGGESSAGEE
jgi:hypothetical protein